MQSASFISAILFVAALVSTGLAQTPATAPAIKGGTVTRGDKSAVVEKVPFLAWGQTGETTYCGALSSALAVTDRPTNYATLMGDSGLAFRVRWWLADDGKGWMMASPVGEMPDWIDMAEKSIGWKMRWEVHFDGKPPMANFKPDIVKSIDAGLPVLLYGRSFDVGVAYGYEADGDVLFVHDNFVGNKRTTLPAKDIKSVIALFTTERTAPLARKAAILQGVRLALRDWKHVADKTKDDRFGPGAYYYGADAMAKWIENLKSADELPADRKRVLFDANWWVMCVMNDARFAAARYLRTAAPQFEGKANDELLAAADEYEQVARTFGGPTWEERAVFFGPWAGDGEQNFKKWTLEVRKREIELLTEANNHETAAIKHLTAALPEIEAANADEDAN